MAEINEALVAVSQLVDLGYKVIFDKNLENGQDMSYMTHKATNVSDIESQARAQCMGSRRLCQCQQ